MRAYPRYCHCGGVCRRCVQAGLVMTRGRELLMFPVAAEATKGLRGGTATASVIIAHAPGGSLVVFPVSAGAPADAAATGTRLGSKPKSATCGPGPQIQIKPGQTRRPSKPRQPTPDIPRTCIQRRPNSGARTLERPRQHNTRYIDLKSPGWTGGAHEQRAPEGYSRHAAELYVAVAEKSTAFMQYLVWRNPTALKDHLLSLARPYT